jgi:hypothetical protein
MQKRLPPSEKRVKKRGREMLVLRQKNEEKSIALFSSEA